MEASKRNYGIDLLRIFAMVLVIVLHINGKGGLLATTTGTSEHVTQFLELAAYCAVNLYALISGYVGASSRGHRRWISATLSLWIAGVFYNVVISLWSRHAGLEDVMGGRLGIIKLFTPISNRTWWYLSAYVGASFFFPFIAALIDRQDEKEQLMGGLLSFLLFSCMTTYARMSTGSDTFNLGNGYTALWLLVLYYIGAVIKRCQSIDSLPSWVLLLAAGFMVFISYYWFYHIDEVIVKEGGSFARVLYNYTSPTIFICAVCLLVVFSRLQIQLGSRGHTVLTRVSHATFGVYLIHVHPLIFEQPWKGSFAWLSELSPALLPFGVFGCALCVLAICTIVELLRQLLFDSLASAVRTVFSASGAVSDN